MTKPTPKTLNPRRAVAGDLAVTLGSVFAALLLTLLLAGLPLQLAAPAVVVGVVAAIWRLSDIHEA